MHLKGHKSELKNWHRGLKAFYPGRHTDDSLVIDVHDQKAGSIQISKNSNIKLLYLRKRRIKSKLSLKIALILNFPHFRVMFMNIINKLFYNLVLREGKN